jgi:hypothetical protein
MSFNRCSNGSGNRVKGFGNPTHPEGWATAQGKAELEATADLLYGSPDEIFAKIERYRRLKKYRALELFREIDKNRDGNLKIMEVMSFVKRVVPDVTDVQVCACPIPNPNPYSNRPLKPLNPLARVEGGTGLISTAARSRAGSTCP